MKTSVIRYRVADFLRENAPFHHFTMEELLAFAGSGKVAFHEDLVFLFEKGEPRSGTAWVIQQGRIEIWNREGDEDRMVDLLGPGDILGLRGGADEDTWPVSARTATEVILYGFDLETLVSYSRNHPEAMAFLDAASAATTPGGKASLRSPLLTSEKEKNSWISSTEPVSIPGRINSSRSQGEVEMKEFPAVTPGGTVPGYLIAMMRNRATSLLITSDGTPEGELIGVIAEEDLAAECGRNPALLLRKALDGGSEAELTRICKWMKKFITQELAGPSAVPFLSEVVSLWNDALLEAATQLVLNRTGNELSDFNLLVFGSTARRESLEIGINELGVVIAGDPETNLIINKFCRELGETLATVFGHTPALQVMSPDLWCEFYAARIREPIATEYYLTREMLDFRNVYGRPEIAGRLRQIVEQEIEKDASFIRLLAHDTIANQPPLTWLKDSIVQADGSESGKLDIDKTVLTPLADSARVIAIANRGLNGTGTLQRLAEASEKYPQYEPILNDAAAGWREAAYVRAILKSEPDAGPGSLSRLDQRLLKMSFDSTRQFLELTTSLFRTVES